MSIHYHHNKAKFNIENYSEDMYENLNTFANKYLTKETPTHQNFDEVFDKLFSCYSTLCR